MALDLIFPLSDGGRRSGLDLKKTRRTDQAKGFSKRCYLGRETHLFDPSTFFEFTLFLRMRSSSLLLTVVSASFRRSAWNIYWVSYGPHSAAFSCQTICLQPTHLLFFLRALFSPSSPSSCSLPLPLFFFFFFNGSSSSESSLTKSSMSPPFLRLKMQNKSHRLCCLRSNIWWTCHQ